uniref:Transmembrane protein 182 n=1 Tax=Nothoprocta perdicaria TaxID=30464 RepID=A0A8C6ZY49_NOTPE
MIELLTFHHEGFFWRCWFFGEGDVGTIWSFWYSDLHPSKVIAHAQVSWSRPTPGVAVWVFRGFWTAFITLAVAASLVGGFLLVCGVPFGSARFHKAGGGFLLAAGFLYLLLVFLFVLWKELAADLHKYILLERSEKCLDDVPVHVYYGWSFMFAAAGVPLVLLAGLLFYLVGRDIMKSLE